MVTFGSGASLVGQHAKKAIRGLLRVTANEGAQDTSRVNMVFTPGVGAWSEALAGHARPFAGEDPAGPLRRFQE